VLTVRSVLSCVLVIFALGTVTLVIRSSSTFADCVSKNQQYEGHTQSQERPRLILVPLPRGIVVSWRCTKYFANQNSPSITAFGTLVIAAFTIILGVFTVSVANSTRMAAVASIEAERPHIRLSKLTLTRFGNPSGMPIITATCRNYGRSVAIITQACVSVRVMGTLPRKPTYDGKRYVFQGNVIPPNGEFELPKFYFFEWSKYHGEIPGFEFKALVWVYGFVTYLDHVNVEHRHGFVAEWMPPDTIGPQPEGEDFLWTGQKHYKYDT
jgi:hypothetical protein